MIPNRLSITMAGLIIDYLFSSLINYSLPMTQIESANRPRQTVHKLQTKKRKKEKKKTTTKNNSNQCPFNQTVITVVDRIHYRQQQEGQDGSVLLTWVPDKFQVNWPFSSGEVQNRFSRWWLWQPSWISDRNYFRYFCFTNHPDTSYQVSIQLIFWFSRRSSK